MAQEQDIPQRLPLAIKQGNRGTSKTEDARLINGYLEQVEEGIFSLYKRPGVSRSSQPSGGAATARGMFNWNGDIFSIFGATLYKNGVAVSGTLDTTNGSYKFEISKGSTPRFQLGNGVKAYNYDTGAGLVQITDANFPSSFVKGWAYLDGTTYVGTAANAIQGSDINDTTAWNPLNTIQAQIEADAGVAIAKHLVYVVMLKQFNTEVFYDAGNAAGSPLGSVQGANSKFGCVSADSVVDAEGSLYWIGTSKSASPQILRMENLKIDIISTPAIERLLDEADFTTVYAFAIKEHGHLFYVLTLKVSNLTLVYDVNQQLWYQWTDVNGNYFPFVAAVSDNNLNHYLQHESDGYIYSIDEDAHKDHAGLFAVDIYTPGYDAGTSRRKTLNALNFIGDQVPGSTLQVRHNDSDYAADGWSQFRTVDMGQKAPKLTKEGTFVKRAYHIRHKGDMKLRLAAIELDMLLGSI